MVARAWPVMGTTMSGAAWGADTVALARALAAARDSVALLDSLLSIERDDSEIAAVNRRPGGVRGGPVSTHLTAALAEARAISAASRGALAVGSPNRIDLSGIARGYALDRAAQALAGVADSALLDLGGLFYWVGPPTRRIVGIAHPERALDGIAAVEMRGGAARTASRQDHPERRSSTRTVTVLAASGAAADAWSSALFLMGCDSALAVVPRLSPWRLSVVCADSGGVRWSPDLEGRVQLLTSPGAPSPPRPAPGR